jgi:hypothetical protein
LQAVVLLLGPSQSVTASAGAFNLSSQIEYSSMTPNATTSISVIQRTSTTISTITLTSTGPGVTITMTLSAVDP